jgi:PRTRC genetic system protein C
MAITTTELKRVFRLKKGSETIVLDDPNENLTPDEVLSMYTGAHPELTTATVMAPIVEGDQVIYEFSSTIGTKG